MYLLWSCVGKRKTMHVFCCASIALSLLLLLSLLALVESFSLSASTPKTSSWRARSKNTLLSNSKRAAEDSNSDGSSSSHRPPPAAATDSKYAIGAELKQLRYDLANFRENLQWSTALDDQDKVEAMTKAIADAEARDPDIAYAKTLAEIKDLKTRTDITADEKDKQQRMLQEKASHVRSLLPQFNLDGLWVGNYGKHGVQLVNVTYTHGDTLIATKATGDINVPRGQVSFTVDLSPSFPPNSTLEPLKVSFEKSSSSSSNKKNKKKNAATATATATTSFPRYAGLGQVAKPGFVDNKHVDGQLILLENHFSFVWMPPNNQRHHVLFRRPTPEQTLSLLRNVLSREDELQNMREHLARCLDTDMTDSLARQCAGQVTEEPFRRIASQKDLEQWEQAQKKKAGDFVRGKDNAANNGRAWRFWQVHKWKQYIDRMLGEHDQEYN